MKKSRFTDSQIIAVMKRAEAGKPHLIACSSEAPDELGLPRTLSARGVITMRKPGVASGLAPRSRQAQGMPSTQSIQHSIPQVLKLATSDTDLPGGFGLRRPHGAVSKLLRRLRL